MGIATTRLKLVIETVLLSDTHSYQKVFFNQKVQELLSCQGLQKKISQTKSVTSGEKN